MKLFVGYETTGVEAILDCEIGAVFAKRLIVRRAPGCAVRKRKGLREARDAALKGRRYNSEKPQVQKADLSYSSGVRSQLERAPIAGLDAVNAAPRPPHSTLLAGVGAGLDW